MVFFNYDFLFQVFLVQLKLIAKYGDVMFVKLVERDISGSNHWSDIKEKNAIKNHNTVVQFAKHESDINGC